VQEGEQMTSTETCKLDLPPEERNIRSSHTTHSPKGFQGSSAAWALKSISLSLTHTSHYKLNKPSSLRNTWEWDESIYTQLNISRSFGWFLIFIKKYFLRIRQPTKEESSTALIKTLLNHMAYRQDKVCKQR